MSIIHEALKKTQKQKESLSAQSPIESPGHIYKKDEKNKKKSFLKSVKYPVSVLVLSGFLVFIFAFRPGPVVEKPVEPESNIFSKYMLEGIVYDENAPFAVINGKAVKRLERIDEFIVSSISENEVELTEPIEGGKITLSLAF